ncbi:MAG: MoaD/ThiS family protein [Kangiellaceae bacterium]|nr:MoaD/ThiS family protein [Kangiellaceae bacterium]MCW9017681.1 MoaD/ThiS family protein [Kangiellaceae bacterium]
MPKVTFTENLVRHIDCPACEVDANTVAEALQKVFAQYERLGTYILDDQGRLRKHILISVDDNLLNDRIHLSDPVKQHSEIYVLQALSGG